MRGTVRRALDLFEARERWLLAGLFAMMLAMALVQTVSVASILPFMNLVAGPEAIQESRILRHLHEAMAFESDRSFLFFVGILVLGLMAFSNGLSIVTQWLMVRFVWHQQYEVSLRLMRKYLGEPYTFFLERNSSGLTKNMFVEVREAINGVVMPGMKMLAQSLVVLSIFTLLMLVDPVLAIASTVVLGGAYGVLYGIVRRKQAYLGRVRSRLNEERFRTAFEALGGIKESRVLGREYAFLRRFAAPTRRFSRVSSTNQIITELPRYAIETLAFGGILVIVLYILGTREEFGQAIAVVSLYALAGYRLMPALQQIFGGLTKIRFYSAALAGLHQDLTAATGTRSLPSTAVDALAFEEDLRVERMTFRYPGTDAEVLKAIDLRIPKFSTVGFVGSTGSGKTTLVDIILGLLEPTEGALSVDGVRLTPELLPAWRQNLGYVPQEIFLADDTMARNIAFGVPPEEVDPSKVERAAKIAQVHDFIQSLPSGYDTVVGERGVRLSGGQKQRIGIARAMYREPEILVLDEATSALDGITEDGVMDALRELAGRKTIILVAHRITTLKDCSTIHLFRDGELADSGTYEELMGRSEQFRAMSKTDTRPMLQGAP